MGIEGEGCESAGGLVHGGCKEHSLSPPGDDGDSSKSTASGDDDYDWIVSDSEEDEDYENHGKNLIFSLSQLLSYPSHLFSF